MVKKSSFNWLQSTAVRIARFHFLYIAAYLISIIIFDSWNLIEHESVVKFWTAGGTLLALNTVVWYVCRINFSASVVYVSTLQLLIVADILLAAFTVYWERGLASSSVVLFAVPIITSAALRSRTTLLATASLSVAAYSIAVVRFFYQHYGESFRVELYGEIAFYSTLFFILVGLLWVVIHPEQKH